MEKNKFISGKQAIWYRNYRRARDRAMVRLAHAYPETYKELLEQEKMSDVNQGKNFVAIDNEFVVAVGIGSAGSDTPSRQASEYHKEDEGDNGGET